jgi:hypothetical protein
MLDIPIYDFIVKSLASGIIATTGMTLLLTAVTKSGIANADMVRAVGSLFTKSLDNAVKRGLIIHFSVGLFFGFLYTFAIHAFEVEGFLSTVGSGVLIGFIHGAVVSFMLVAAVAEHHPLKEFQKAGFSVAVAHWAAHLFYGLLVGIVLGLMNI